jgi:hypothetical protein
MSSKHKRFITLTLCDTESWGYDEVTLPMLLQLVDSSAPDQRMFAPTDVTANYLTSRKALKTIEDIITKAEGLRDNDPRFATLGISLAEGEWIAEFNLLGRPNSDHMLPVAGSLVDAMRTARKPEGYRKILQTLRENILK